MADGNGDAGGVFRRSSYCGGGSCVEIDRGGPDGVRARSSADPEVVLTFTSDEWRAFVAGVKAGEFDLS